jgi:hypothetical protein
MRQARVIVGGDVELFGDANGGYGRKQAIRIMHAAADLDVRWFEEPVSANTMNPKSPTSATRRRGTPVDALNTGSYGSSQILASSVTIVSNAGSGSPCICRSAPDSI